MSSARRSRDDLGRADEHPPGCRPRPGAISSSGTIALISFFVGIEVAAAFVAIVGELLEQTLLRQRSA
jgi:hypothetical protein